MTSVMRLRENRWVVRDRGDEWEFKTHAEAQKKAEEVNGEKLKQMSNANNR